MQTYPLRSVLKKFFRLVFRVLTRLQVEGMENIPPSGGYLLAANHLSVVDAPLVFALLERDDITGLVAKKHLKNPLFRSLVNAVGGIWLNRDEADTRALRAAVAHLQGGGMLGISPEGTRSRETQAMIAAKNGVTYLADKANVPIIPVAVWGTESTFTDLFKFRRPRLSMRVGKPFSLSPITRASRDAALRSNTEEIMCRIAALLPAQYHGVYADHPRLLQLLAERG